MKVSIGALLTLTLVLSTSTPLMSFASQQMPSAGALLPFVASTSSDAPASTAAFSLDGVDLKLSTSFLSDLEFATSDPNTAIQIAAAVERVPLYKELSITSVPFGLKPPTESLPTAAPNGAVAYRPALEAYRTARGGDPEDGPVIRLFGKDVTGLRSEAHIHIRGASPTRTTITEWVVEAGGRIWIVRASQELEDSAGVQPQSTDPFSDTTLWSDDLGQPSTSLAAIEENLPPSNLDPEMLIAANAVASDLPYPSWWSGECDTNNYYAATGRSAYPLGAEYRGMKACGPRPWADWGPAAFVNFGAGVSQIEWQCPELSKRFLYLAYDIPPYLADGSEVVWHYSGDLLEKVPNCQAGRAPEPDDVLSYGSTSTYGHTSVVVASDVDAAGNGTIAVIEQNNSSTGFNTIDVEDWCVGSGSGAVSGWLHNPAKNGWAAEYYSDDQLTTKCLDSRLNSTYIFGNWGEESPGGGCPADHFSARFSREIDFAGGDYTFALDYDDGARLKIDGETVIDGWETSDQPYVTRHIESGYHELEIEYREDVREAYLTALWWGPGFDLPREARDSSRWYAQHWGNQALWGVPVVTVNEGAGFLDHDWDYGAAATVLPNDHFSSRFERRVHLDAGRWRFVLSADDGVRLWINGDRIMDEWQDQVATFRSELDLSEGDHELKLEHYENLGAALVRLSWEQVTLTTTLTGRITSPIDAATVVSCPLTIEAEVSDASAPEVSGVDLVEFYAAYDDTWHHLGDDPAPPYQCVWDCSSVDNQGVWLSIHARNSAGGRAADIGGHVYVHLDVPRYLYLPIITRDSPAISRDFPAISRDSPAVSRDFPAVSRATNETTKDN